MPQEADMKFVYRVITFSLMFSITRIYPVSTESIESQEGHGSPEEFRIESGKEQGSSEQYVGTYLMTIVFMCAAIHLLLKFSIYI